MNILTRPAIPSDVESLFSIRTSVTENHQSREQHAALGITPETVSAMLASPRYACYIAEVDGIPAAFSMTEFQEGRGAYLFALFVRPEYENHGLGRTLLNLTEQTARAKGHTRLWLSTGNGPNLRAHGFYQHLGWRQEGILPDGQAIFRKRLD